MRRKQPALTGKALQPNDVVITMGCGDTCPYFPGVSYRDWKLDDPAGQPLDVVRRSVTTSPSGSAPSSTNYCPPPPTPHEIPAPPEAV
jgi:hypothetical protein